MKNCPIWFAWEIDNLVSPKSNWSDAPEIDFYYLQSKIVCLKVEKVFVGLVAFENIFNAVIWISLWSFLSPISLKLYSFTLCAIFFEVLSEKRLFFNFSAILATRKWLCSWFPFGTWCCLGYKSLRSWTSCSSCHCLAGLDLPAS